jgi:polyvinyl alcohol dehydrogenase (cytochrome)
MIRRALVLVAAAGLLASGLLSAGVDAVSAAVSGTPPATVTTVLATYHGDMARDGYSPNEAKITARNAGSLATLWTTNSVNSTTISAQPAVAHGVTYWGDWSGIEHATSATGQSLWETFLGQTNDTGCDPNPVGVASSATVGTVNGRKVVITGGGAGNIVELDATTGAIIWKKRIAPPVGGFVWSSAALWNGSVYIGESSYGDCPLVAGHVYMLNAATGRYEHSFKTVDTSQGCTGAGVWSSPAIDPVADALYVSTGNDTCNGPLQNAILELDASTLALKGSWQIPLAQQVTDSDWGSTPTLFTAQIRGRLVGLVGSAAKNGIFYAFRSGALSRGPIWQDRLATGGDCPQCGNGSIAPALFDGTSLYAAGGTTTIAGQSCAGSVQALDPSTGQPIWQDCLEGGPVLGAVTGVRNLLFAGDGDQLVGIATGTGAQVFSYTEVSTGWFYAPPTVVGGVLYAGNTDGSLQAWGLPKTAKK